MRVVVVKGIAYIALLRCCHKSISLVSIRNTASESATAAQTTQVLGQVGHCFIELRFRLHGSGDACRASAGGRKAWEQSVESSELCKGFSTGSGMDKTHLRVLHAQCAQRR